MVNRKIIVKFMVKQQLYWERYITCFDFLSAKMEGHMHC